MTECPCKLIHMDLVGPSCHVLDNIANLSGQNECGKTKMEKMV
jgi:hypothetical protein